MVVGGARKTTRSYVLGFALLGNDSNDETADGASVKDRLRAWWNGDELPVRPAPQGGNRKKSDQRAHDDGDAGGADAGGAGDNSWPEIRRKLAEKIWSTGFVLPGGTDYAESLVSGCSLTAAETMLEIGVGMGGGTQIIIGKFGNYVSGYERDADLAAAAMRHAVTYNIDEKLVVKTVPFEELNLKSKYFRAALMREIVYTMEDKAGLIAKISDSLKTGSSHLVMTDLLFDADDGSEELAAWKAVEGRPVYPWTEAALTKALGRAEMQPRIIDDESEEYCAMVVDAWSEYMKTIEGVEIAPEMGRVLEREGEYWARRVAALKAGVLHYYRVEAIKNT
ncbi:MAG: hypothetical protein O3C49_00160 [Proteobacteria bacterium]|nr:hypothetical protein [Pseudomonadota bacterium]MDA1326506.1 hypothetical protein [Pseudomonadota bacterium]